MTRVLPPLDLHAHIAPSVTPRELEGLGAVVFAATRSLDEFDEVSERSDRVTVWGIGCHPRDASAQWGFDAKRFAQGLRLTPYVSEVGLDGVSKVPMDRQTETFRQVLLHAVDAPRIVSIHSLRAAERVLDLIEETGAVGIVLHWWLGSQQQTSRALELGCSFSVNGTMRLPDLRDAGVPLGSLLPETDHPSGNRRTGGRRQPGWTVDVEKAVAALYGLPVEDVRQQFWFNLAGLTHRLQIDKMFPRPVQAMLAAARQGTVARPSRASGVPECGNAHG